MSSLLVINDLHVSAGNKEIIRGLNLTIRPGEIHAVMGPNGSGKSTLANALMGHPAFTVTAGDVRFLGKKLLTMEPHERALAGLFLAFQYPKEIAGVTLRSFLFAAWKLQMRARSPKIPAVSPVKFKALLLEHMAALKMDPALAERAVNQKFSGGEKKKAEILQMRILSPLLAILDETDSGLDIDALKIVAKGVSDMRRHQSQVASRKSPVASRKSPFSALIVTHYARLLHYLKPDYVHVMVDGRIVESGGAELAKKLEKEGYRKYHGHL